VTSVQNDRKPVRPGKPSRRLSVIALCLGLSTLASVPFFFAGEIRDGQDAQILRMPLTHDMLTHFDQMKSFYDGLAGGEIYPRWEEDTNRGFGAPTTSYYPPGVYYLTSCFYLLTGDWMTTLLLTFLAMMVASAAAIYLYARRLMNKRAALVAMATYIFLPYHLVDQYARGAMAELLAFTFMPLMLLFGENLLTRNSAVSKPLGDFCVQAETSNLAGSGRSLSRDLLNAVGLAVSLGGFLWAHPPTAYQFALAFGIYMLLLAAMRRMWRRLTLLALATAVALALSAAYVLPAFVERDMIRRENVTEMWPYHGTYVFLHAAPHANPIGTFSKLIDFIWIFNTLAILLAAVILVAIERTLLKASPALRHRILAWVVVGFFACFMMTTASQPVGRLIPAIEIGVFSWRMLSITTLIAALLAGACAQAAINAFKLQPQPPRNPLASLAALAILGGAVFMAVRLMPPLYRGPAFSPVKEHFNFAMIPRTAPEDPRELPKVERAELASRSGRVSVEKWNPEQRLLTVDSSTADRLLIRTFNFPGWSATIDGRPTHILTGEALRIEHGGDEGTLVRADTFGERTPIINGMPGSIIGREPLGDIVIEVPAGVHRVDLNYLNTPVRCLGVIINASAILITVTLVAAALIMRRRSEVR
jgi:Dolichyl-phosphate-mannose-protein mannosyltransferase